MIRSFIRACFIFLAVITISLWFSLQINTTQKWAKNSISRALQKELGIQVHIGKVQGLAPFYLTLENISCQDPELSIGSFTIVPNWFGFLLANSSFFYIGLHDVDLSHVQTASKSSSFTDLLPKTPIHIWAFRISYLTLAKEYNTPFLNDFNDDIDAGLRFTIFADAHWRPKNQTLSSSISVTPKAANTGLGTFSAAIRADKERTRITTSIKAVQPKAGSVFISLPCDTLDFSSDLSAKTSELLSAWTTTQSFAPLQGSWKLSGTKKEEPSLLSPSIRFEVAGSIDIPATGPISVATTGVQCAELFPSIGDYRQTTPLGIDAQKKQNPINDIPVSGTISAKVDAQTLDHMTLSLSTSQITVQDKRFEPIDLVLECDASKSDWQGLFSLNASLQNGAKITANTRWKSDMHTNLDLSEIDCEFAKQKILGNLNMHFFPFQIAGSLKSSSADSAPLFSLFGLEASGSTRLSCQFAADPDSLSQTATVDIDCENIKTDSFHLESANLTLHSEGLFPKPTVDIHATVSNVETKQGALEQLKAETTLYLDNKQESLFSLHATGHSVNGPYALTCLGAYKDTYASINTLQLVSNNQMLHIQEPIQIHPNKIIPFDLFVNDKTVLTASFEKTATTVSSEVLFCDLPIQFLNPILPHTLFGTISGQFELSGHYNNPKAHLSLATSDLSFWPLHETRFEPQMASIQLTHADRSCTIQAQVQNLHSQSPLSLSVTLPVSFSLAPFSFSTHKDKPIQGTLKGALDLDTIFNSEDEDFGGTALFDLRASGTIHKPYLFGTFGMQHGKWRMPALNAELFDINANVSFKKNVATLDSFTCKDNQLGELSGSGALFFSSLEKLHYELLATLKNYDIVKRDEAHVTSSGSIKLTGSLNEAHLTGSLPVVQAKLLLTPQKQDVPKLDITYKNMPEALLPIRQDPFLFNFDLEIDLPKNGLIYGLGLESLWQGKVQLTGQNKNIFLSGKIESHSGTFTFADKMFKIKKGSVDFRGALEKSHLFVVANHEVADILAQIILKGPLDSPKLSLQSTPPMKEKEILSWILFNKSASEISPMQGLQLAQHLMKLQNGSNADIINKIKESLGLDRIDFGTKGQIGPQPNGQGIGGANGVVLQESMPNEVSFQVGKYISDGVMVTLSKDVTNEVNRVGVEACVAGNITAEANVGDNAETQVSLKWKVRY